MVKRRSLLWMLTCGALWHAAACGDDDSSQSQINAPSPDGGDAWDGAADVPLQETGAPDAGADLAVDTDAAETDAPQPDASQTDSAQADATEADAPPVVSSVMYLTGDSAWQLSLEQIKLDGTGQVSVSGLPLKMWVNPILITGRHEPAAVSRHRPMAWEHVEPSYRPTSLPGNLGLLFNYTDPVGGGFFVVHPDGTAKLLSFQAGALNQTYCSFVGLNDTGTILAAGVGCSPAMTTEIRLLRTDGQNFGTTSSGVCDVTPASPALTDARVASLTFGATHSYFVGRDASSTTTDRLYRAPLDCSAKASQVTLPQVGGTAVGSIRAQLLRSEDGKKIAVLAEGIPSYLDVMQVDDATGAVTNVSESPTPIAESGLSYAHSGTKVDLSPLGTQVAWVTNGGLFGRQDLYVRPTDKSAAAAHLTNAADFAIDYDRVGGVQFVNEDDLFFWVGSSNAPFADAADLFRYRISTKTLTQITKTGGTIKPYSGVVKKPTARAEGGWISPGGKYLYLLQYDEPNGSNGPQCNIRAIDRTTAAVTDITTNRYVDPGLAGQAGNIEAALTGGKVFFYARTFYDSPYDDQLYVFDQNVASAPVKLTSFTGSSRIYDIMPSADGSLVAFSQSTSGDDGSQQMFVAQVGATLAVHQLTTTTGYARVTDMKCFSSDGQHVVYGLGTDINNAGRELRAQPVAGGAVTLLKSAPAATSPVICW